MGDEEKDKERWLPPSSDNPLSTPPPGAPQQGETKWGAPAPPPAPGLEGGFTGAASTGELPVIRSLPFCILMLIGSLGVWSFAWIWHTAKEVTPRVAVQGESDMDAGLRTGLFWIPILNWVITYWSWRDTQRFAESAGVKSYSAGMFVAGYVATQLISIVPVLAWVGLIGLVFPIIVQNKLNESWRRHEPTRAGTAPMMQADWITLGIGLALWALGIVILIAVIAAS